MPERMPRVSIIVILHRIPRQADNTLYSLSTRHQRHVTEDDYEIVVVENESDAEYGEARSRAHGDNVRYFRRREEGVSPVPAVNFGFDQARAPFVGFMIDGAHMVTPRLVEHVLRAERLHDCPIVSVPAHHLGHQEQHLNKTTGYDEAVEQRLLASAKWKDDGYALFDIACWSGANYNGYFCPSMESNALFCTRAAFESIGRADVRFDGAGGGLVNQDIYARLCRVPRSRLVVLAGEGSFHQFHGGVSTSEFEGREEVLESLRLQHVAIRGHRIIGYDREPLVVGVFSRQGLAFLKRSAELGYLRHHMCAAEGRPPWPND
jgi:glycosyltransferase involved in cell wall biosynthesis